MFHNFLTLVVNRFFVDFFAVFGLVFVLIEILAIDGMLALRVFLVYNRAFADFLRVIDGSYVVDALNGEVVVALFEGL